MKKILFLFICMILCITPVKAKEELIIKNLKINNGVITPNYDKYNNYYSVTITENVNSLDFEYEYNNELYEVKVSDNENLVQNKMVYVTIYDKKTNEQNTYIFKIYIEDSLSTMEAEDTITALDIKTEDKTNYAPLVGSGCFSLIIFIYYLIFLK